jgi:hypothetical protein
MCMGKRCCGRNTLILVRGCMEKNVFYPHTRSWSHGRFCRPRLTSLWAVHRQLQAKPKRRLVRTKCQRSSWQSLILFLFFTSLYCPTFRPPLSGWFAGLLEKNGSREEY